MRHKKTYQISSNGVGAPRIIDRLSHTYTQIQCQKAKNLKRRIALAIILHNLFFLVKQFHAFRGVSH